MVDWRIGVAALGLVAGCSSDRTLYEGFVSLSPVVADDYVYFGTMDNGESAIRRVRDDGDRVEMRWRQRSATAYGAGLVVDRGRLLWSTVDDDGLATGIYRLVTHDRAQLGTLYGLDAVVGLVVDGQRLYVATRDAIFWMPLDGGDLGFIGSPPGGMWFTAMSVRDGNVLALATVIGSGGPVTLLEVVDDARRVIATVQGASPESFAARGWYAWFAGGDAILRVDLVDGTTERVAEAPVHAIVRDGDHVYATVGEPDNAALVDVEDPYIPIAVGLTGSDALAFGEDRIYYVDAEGLRFVER